MIPEVLLTALLLGWVLGGRFGRLADVKIRYIWMVFVPLGMMVGTRLLNYSHAVPYPSPLYAVARVVELFSLCVFTVANWSIAGAPLVLAGLLINLVVVAINGGMPVSYNALAVMTGEHKLSALLKMYPFVRNMLTTAGTRLYYLCDILPARRPFVVFPGVYSVGDIVTSIGGLIAIVAIMRKPLPSDRKLATEER